MSTAIDTHASPSIARHVREDFTADAVHVFSGGLCRGKRAWLTPPVVWDGEVHFVRETIRARGQQVTRLTAWTSRRTAHAVAARIVSDATAEAAWTSMVTDGAFSVTGGATAITVTEHDGATVVEWGEARRLVGAEAAAWLQAHPAAGGWLREGDTCRQITIDDDLATVPTESVWCLALDAKLDVEAWA